MGLGVGKTLRILENAGFDHTELKDAIIRNFELGDGSLNARRYLRYMDRFFKAVA